MLFTSGIFLYWFLPLFLAAYFATPARWRAIPLALGSWIFYGWWRPDFVLLMWASTVVDFTAGRGIERDHARGHRGRRWVWLSCVVNLGLLAYFKYANFGIESLNALLGNMGREPIPWTEVVLPVGISFYTFQTLSYTIDVYRRQAPPVERFIDFACYVSMFPQLVAGPIVRYQTVAAQLRERTHSLALAGTGLLFFQAGLAKKVLLADTFAIPADHAFAATELGALDAWIGALAYTFQIYFDFSGYSDMAIGLGLLMGFRFPINFASPYRSRSITEFWRRWHISLSSFLRDYLYVPLGGNRKGHVRTYVNLAVTMLLGGLWHGAAWTFVAWGAYQGAWLIAERAAGRRALWSALPAVLQNAVAFVVVVMGWVLFRAESLPQAIDHLASMFGLRSGSPVWLALDRTHAAAALAAAAIVWGCPTTQDQARRPRGAWVFALQILFVAALLQLLRASHVPFLYFQF